MLVSLQSTSLKYALLTNETHTHFTHSHRCTKENDEKRNEN